MSNSNRRDFLKNDSIYKIIYTVVQYDHTWGWTAIAGGYEYSGTAIPQLAGKFIFGDIPSGKLFYVNMIDIKQGRQAPIYEWRVSINGSVKTFKELCGNGMVGLRFGQDVRSELYILTKADGKMYKLVSAGVKPLNVH